MTRQRYTGNETKYQTYREKQRDEDDLIRAGAGGQEVHNGHFIVKKESRRAGSAGTGARAQIMYEVRENGEMTGPKTRGRGRGRGDEGEKKRSGREQVDATARVENEVETRATRRRGSPREGGRALRQGGAPTLTSILTWP